MDKLRLFLSRLTVPFALFALFLSMGGTWHTSSAAPPLVVPTPPPRVSSSPRPSTAPPSATPPSSSPPPHTRPAKKPPTGKLNLNTASEEQLMMLPTVGPSKADRIVTWRRRNGGFKRVADLRRVKGFGYRTFKRLEPLLTVQGDTTIAYAQ